MALLLNCDTVSMYHGRELVDRHLAVLALAVLLVSSRSCVLKCAKMSQSRGLKLATPTLVST